MWNVSWPPDCVWINLLSSDPCRGRASSSDRMSSSAEPFFSSRSSARVLITVINRYSVDRNTESTHAIGGHR